ncbi:MAG TPA: enoyl-CoA hydratase [Acidimicrobiaceae bacterium]|mgnify:CR=1 FL=1|nr:enoyl-CoA hydratase [Acidimicrobiaceae bacterium]HAX05676.1 enoyl-CoA hydratase [Acidimicrobiaceae bacterium]|tara:strand:- start:719 stop:1546 length:828 start_codon:yes stop_codon:yes gene_type:complete
MSILLRRDIYVATPQFTNETVTTSVVDGMGTVTLNRPEARNALSSELLSALPEALRSLDEDPEVDVLVLTGADPAFCAGLDLKELGGSGENINPNRPLKARGPFPSYSKPLIGAINGVAVTGGLELALACDFLIASDRAAFADTHARVGVMPGWGLSVLLPQAIGLRRAREMSLTGNYIDAQTAAAWGLVNRVVPHELLLETVRSLASDISSNDQEGVQQILKTYERTGDTTVAEGWEIEAAMGSDWLDRTNFKPEKVAQRRAEIQSRGRNQNSS